ncbi:hypothetical protein [Streptomyces sp. NPDC006012]|uniref:hypothetical protein n=1 Tax=Streptomyces sp. NPDC006012 TaxID=3364739 RepID=UPI0036C2CDB7
MGLSEVLFRKQQGRISCLSGIVPGTAHHLVQGDAPAPGVPNVFPGDDPNSDKDYRQGAEDVVNGICMLVRDRLNRKVITTDDLFKHDTWTDPMFPGFSDENSYFQPMVPGACPTVNQDYPVSGDVGQESKDFGLEYFKVNHMEGVKLVQQIDDAFRALVKDGALKGNYQMLLHGLNVQRYSKQNPPWVRYAVMERNYRVENGKGICHVYASFLSFDPAYVYLKDKRERVQKYLKKALLDDIRKSDEYFHFET